MLVFAGVSRKCVTERRLETPLWGGRCAPHLPSREEGRRSRMVASVGRITAGRGYDYLTRDVATSKHDYYTGRGEAPGVWTGRGAGLIGLAGEVDAGDMAVLYGRFVVPSTVGGARLPSGRWQPEEVLGRQVVAKTRADGSV